MPAHAIGPGKVNISITLPEAEARELGRLACVNDISRAEYVRRFIRFALAQGIQFTKAAAVVALLAVTLWATAGRDDLGRLARGRRGRRDEIVCESLGGGDA